MKVIKSKRVSILVMLLIISIILLFIVKSEKDALQKNMDIVFTNAIQDSMKGLSYDYSEIDSKQKIQCNYQTLNNLYEALDVFDLTTYKKHADLFQTLDRLYIFLLDNQSESYEIDDNAKIFGFLGKIIVYPDDNQLISDFNSFLDSKDK